MAVTSCRRALNADLCGFVQLYLEYNSNYMLVLLNMHMKYRSHLLNQTKMNLKNIDK